MSKENVVCYFEPEPFAQGRFRYAYKARWTEYSSKPAGTTCVVKKFKNTYTYESSGWDNTMLMYSRSKDMACRFGHKLEYTDCEKLHVRKDAVGCDGARTPRPDEYIVAEEYLEGEFIKWCNNYGYASKEARGVDYILPAFMHWTWVQNRGEEMIADIQGVRIPGGGYKLTDPAIMSTTNKYGSTDTGVEGMAMFFLIHKCSNSCSGLPKPTLAQFVGKIPDSMLQSALELQNLSRSGTTYTHELKFTAEVKQEVVRAFSVIAQGR